MIVSLLKPHVTTFSITLEKNHKHGDEVALGGEIKSIFDTRQVTKEENDGVYIKIDDGLGINTIVIPTQLYDMYKKQLYVGNLIVGIGRLYKMNYAHEYVSSSYKKFRMEHRNENPEYRAMCWSIKEIKYTAEKKTKEEKG